MTSLSKIRAHNATLRSHLGPGLVAVFAGGTSGIGETTARELVRNVEAPRVYIVGRNQSEATRIIDEFKRLSPNGQYHFVAGDLARLREVDRVCAKLKEQEDHINLLVLSQGVLRPGGPNYVGEGLDMKVSLHYYSRIRMLTNLLPQLKAAAKSKQNNGLARVISCLAAGRENNNLNYNDLSLKHNYGILPAEAHACTMMTMTMEHLAAENPQISFVHKFPGIVRTNILRSLHPLLRYSGDALMATVGRLVTIDVKESGERFLYTATSDRYPPKEKAHTVKPDDGEVEIGTNGERGSGAYPLTWNDKRALNEKAMKKHRDEGGIEKVWNHTMEVFDTICVKDQEY
ncbi:hypothetical protein KEM56_007273 [Ascosphaera pollenicola]|nr:hypothetical protein KEM56_007273 [Ascosphaera pollenicola]